MRRFLSEHGGLCAQLAGVGLVGAGIGLVSLPGALVTMGTVVVVAVERWAKAEAVSGQPGRRR